MIFGNKNSIFHENLRFFGNYFISSFGFYVLREKLSVHLVASFESVILNSQSRGKTSFAVFSVIFFLPLRIETPGNLNFLKNYFEKMNLNF